MSDEPFPPADRPTSAENPGALPFAAVSIDLETHPETRAILALGAIRADTGASLHAKGRHVPNALARLDTFCVGTAGLVGHNVIDHDLPHLQATHPNLTLFKLPVVDTLRLNPLAFPRNPYHHLVKHYQDGALKRHQRNDPCLDARLALDVLRSQVEALTKAPPTLTAALHWLTTAAPSASDRALDQLWQQIRQAPRPQPDAAITAICDRLENLACVTQASIVTNNVRPGQWELAYTLAWLSVAGGNSVVPPWVQRRFPGVRTLIRALRDSRCDDKNCNWCRTHHNSTAQLTRWFGYREYRPKPTAPGGTSLQKVIVDKGFARRSVLGILPTGTGKSLCYQIPALARHERTGDLTVVISPLVALMADQIRGLEKKLINAAVTINSQIPLIKREEALDRVRLGDAAILLTSPEQLRSRRLRRTVDQRTVGAWVIDEAHCLSKWGHDFRPDYRYIGRFIEQHARRHDPDNPDPDIPPVLCLTATAKPEVVADILEYFERSVGHELETLNGGTDRPNLQYHVIPTTPEQKLTHVQNAIDRFLPKGGSDGAIVYCATRPHCEETAADLRDLGYQAEHFHAGLAAQDKTDVQNRFVNGHLPIIVATNAFGMGVDKQNVRLVVHADIPDSIENYMQEAGRAGRDLSPAHCVLLFSPDDVDRQFGMSARGRLSRQEIHAVLRAIRNLDRRNRKHGRHDEAAVVATTGEILAADDDHDFERDCLTDDTRVRTAVSWLEDTGRVDRHDNAVRVFPSSLIVDSVDEARRRIRHAINKRGLKHSLEKPLQQIAAALFEADADDTITTDDLSIVAGLEPSDLRHALDLMEELGIARNDTGLTVFVHARTMRPSLQRLDQTSQLEQALIDHMREAHPDQNPGDTASLHLRVAAQELRDGNQLAIDPLPDRLLRLLRSIGNDGRDGHSDGGTGSLTVRRQDRETVRVTLRRSWSSLDATAAIRRDVGARILRHLVDALPKDARGTDLMAKTTLGKLHDIVRSDIGIRSAVDRVERVDRLVQRALLWMHEQDVVRIHHGLAILRHAMTIVPDRSTTKGFSNSDFEPLRIHYEQQVLQIHIMAAYAHHGVDAIKSALALARDYFRLRTKAFIRTWLPGREEEIRHQTTPESWDAIVGSLGDNDQQRIVTAPNEANTLVLAGPGSGKTRVLVHRIAHLVRVDRVRSDAVVALAYNRHAAQQIRYRLHRLIGDDARGVTVLTCHALAMRLAGISFEKRFRQASDADFRAVLRKAVAVLQGTEPTVHNDTDRPDDDDTVQHRARILAGFRWILIDEYQDLKQDEYNLISALAGRTLTDPETKLSIFAVGDDDQNIYEFDGASAAHLRQFHQDYDARPAYLTANYRSTKHLIDAANAVIAPAADRMKTEQSIRINRAREPDPPGGRWRRIDNAVTQGRVHVVETGNTSLVTQARLAIDELTRLSRLDPDWNWSRAAVIAREWDDLDPVRTACETGNIPVQLARDVATEHLLWRLRETQRLVAWIRQHRSITPDEIRAWLATQPASPWNRLLLQAVDEHTTAVGTGTGEAPARHVIEWFAEWSREVRQHQTGLLLVTAHSAKGLEFDHVAVLDGHWNPRNRRDHPDSGRRLYYVAMTRARATLTLLRWNRPQPIQHPLRGHPSVLWHPPPHHPPEPPELRRRYIRPKVNDIDLGYASRLDAGHPAHRAIANLQPGDPVTLHRGRSGRHHLRNAAGTTVGHLATKFEPPAGMQCTAAFVAAVLRRSRSITDPKYHDTIRTNEWEVVIPELIFDPPFPMEQP